MNLPPKQFIKRASGNKVGKKNCLILAADILGGKLDLADTINNRLDINNKALKS